jgi:hypothetical protein
MNRQSPRTEEPKEGTWWPFVVLPFAGAIAICFLGVVVCYLTLARTERQQPSVSRCSPTGGAFSEANVVGTWVAIRPDQRDTLIIRADGTYKQIVHVEFAEGSPIDYESDWQPWHLEYSADRIPYLHLTGMSFCGMNPDIPCQKHDGGGYDFCQDKYLPMNGEGILIVLSNTLYYPLGSENSYIYRPQEP